MAKARDQEALECYVKVLLTLGRFSDYIVWKRLPQEWLAREFPNFTLRAMNEAMQRYVASGGVIDQVEERRPEFLSWRFHYDLRLPMSNRRIYIETVFRQAEDIDDCVIFVVNVHDA